jgi:hypothetical protein
MLAFIPTITGVLLTVIGACMFVPSPGVCRSSEPPPPGSSCPNLPVNYPLASALLGLGILLTVLGAVLLTRQLLHHRGSLPERPRNFSSQ